MLKFQARGRPLASGYTTSLLRCRRENGRTVSGQLTGGFPAAREGQSPPLEFQEFHSMRYLISIASLLGLSVLMIGAVAGQAQQGDGVRRITPAEARAAVAQGKAIIVDVRGEDSYKAGHIKNARWINLNDIGSRAGELPRNKMIITYCS
ncbi:MAG: rhodanese-like domain-containing protein [Acidobacteria bacterium]|nr:rhodanese-like domain-containing protein [Acidobacteriota bacterium]